MPRPPRTALVRRRTTRPATATRLADHQSPHPAARQRMVPCLPRRTRHHRGPHRPPRRRRRREPASPVRPVLRGQDRGRSSSRPSCSPPLTLSTPVIKHPRASAPWGAACPGPARARPPPAAGPAPRTWPPRPQPAGYPHPLPPQPPCTWPPPTPAATPLLSCAASPPPPAPAARPPSCRQPDTPPLPAIQPAAGSSERHERKRSEAERKANSIGAHKSAQSRLAESGG
jgi:hypothetical protein